MNEINLDQFIKQMENWTDEAIDKALETTNENLEDLLNKSNEYAPIDKGDLVGNGSVDPAKKQGDELRSRVGYSKEYALRMHEDIYNLGEQSQEKQESTGKKIGRKYLSRATNENSDKYSKYLAEKLSEVFDK